MDLVFYKKGKSLPFFVKAFFLDSFVIKKERRSSLRLSSYSLIFSFITLQFTANR